MKNFYDSTIIKPNLELTVNLIMLPIGNNIPCQVKINNEIVFDDILNETKTITGTLPLNDPISIAVKINREHPQAVQLVLAIDEQEVLPRYQHLAVPATDYIDFDDEWTIDIPNFYPWFHKVSGQGWIL